MRWALVAMMALAGCSKGRDAEDQYRIVARNGDAAQTCRAAQNTAQAYLSDKNDEGYSKWVKQAEGDCAIARLQSL